MGTLIQSLSIEVPREALLQAVGSLDAEALNHFIEDVLLLRAQRVAPLLGDEEADLRQRIAALGLDETTQKQYHILLKKSEQTQLSDEEQKTLIELVEQSERFNAERITLVIQLAQLLQQPFDTVMQQLGLYNTDVI